jgi:hypothetical protein
MVEIIFRAKIKFNGSLTALTAWISEIYRSPQGIEIESR